MPDEQDPPVDPGAVAALEAVAALAESMLACERLQRELRDANALIWAMVHESGGRLFVSDASLVAGYEYSGVGWSLDPLRGGRLYTTAVARMHPRLPSKE